MRVSSSLSAGSDGVGRVNESLSSLSLRAMSSGSARRSKRVEALASAIVDEMLRWLARAARISVSSVMKVDLTQSARCDSIERSRTSLSALSRKTRASSRLAPLPRLGMFPPPQAVTDRPSTPARSALAGRMS